ncbi:hypothetical protein BsWGS_24718 [Bradybaena similaris]
MLSVEVAEWLAEYKGLSNAEVNTFASTLATNDRLILDLFTLFETPPFHVQELDPVCHQLYEFYRSKEAKLKLFSLQFVATLVWLYLRCLSNGDKKNCGGVETFLLGVYNLEIVKSDGSPMVESFCIPSISKASIYHESRIPGVTEPLTEHALRSLNPTQPMWRCGPYLQHEGFNAQNRFSILSFVMQRFNTHIDSFHKHSLHALCRATVKVSVTGFDLHQDSNENQHPRIPISPSLLVEYLFAVYFAMFNGQHMIALKAVEAAHNRASWELYSDVLLITGAILHSRHRGNLRFEATEVSVGSQKTAYILKNIITNASFKAKKLPDDIDFVEEDESCKLPTLDEDQEHSIAKGFKAKLMTIGGKLGVDKNRNRDAIRRDSDTPSVKSTSGMEFVDSVGVAVRNPGVGGSGKVVVDMLEMQHMRGKGGEDVDGDNTARNSFGEKNSGEHKQMRVSSSPVVLSKKSGILRQTSNSTSGLVNSDYPSITALGYTTSAPSSLLAVSSLPSAPPSSGVANGRPTSGGSNTGSSSMISSTRQPLTDSRSKASDLPHSHRAQSEGPSRDGSKLVATKLPQSSYPSLLSSLSQPFPSSPDSTFHANLSEPLLADHSVSGSQTGFSASTHSVPADVPSDNDVRPSLKSLVNQNSCSTNL